METVYKNFRHKITESGVKKHISNLSWMFFGRIATMITSFVATSIIARHLGPTNYGQLSYAISFTGLFGFVAGLGIDQILLRELSKHPERRDTLTGTSLILSIGAGVLAMTLSTLAALIWSPHDISLLLIIMISSTFITSSFTLISIEFQSQHLSKWPTLLTIGIVLLLNILKILAVFSNKGVIYLAGIISLEPIFYAVGYLFLRAKFQGKLQLLSFDTQLAKTILKDSLPLVFVTAFSSIYARIDQVFLKNMINTSSVGTYDAAVRLSEFWNFIPNIIISGLIPTIIRARESSHQLYIKRSQKLFLIVLTTTIAAAIVTTAIAPIIVSLVFGDKFFASIAILQIYIWSNVGTALSIFTQQILVAENLAWSIFYSSFFGMVANIALCYFLIPKYGGKGAAIASLIAYQIPFIVLFFIKKTRILIREVITGKELPASNLHKQITT